MIGINIVPYSTGKLEVQLQWNRAFNIFSAPSDGMTQLVDTGLMMGGPPSGSYIEVNTPVRTNLGNIDQFGALVMGKIENIGPGDLNLFAAGGISKTDPNTNLFEMPFFSMDGGATWTNAGFGLLYDDCDPMTPGGQCNDDHTGNIIYIGARYDFKKTGTKIGFEFNRGSQYWITFAPAADDIWTSKLGTRGKVYEAYIIQELPEMPIAPFGKAFLRLGYQYYKFEYTGSNNWLGTPKKIDDLNTMDPSGAQMLAPLESARDIYFTFDVTF